MKVWKFMFSKPKKLASCPPIRTHVSLSHIKTRHNYDFPYEFLMNFINICMHMDWYINLKGVKITLIWKKYLYSLCNDECWPLTSSKMLSMSTSFSASLNGELLTLVSTGLPCPIHIKECYQCNDDHLKGISRKYQWVFLHFSDIILIYATVRGAPDLISGQIVKNFTIQYPAGLQDIYLIHFSTKMHWLMIRKSTKVAGWWLVSSPLTEP